MGEGGNYQEEDVTQDGGENVRGKWIWSGKERRKNREGQTGRVASWGGSQEREDEVGGGGAFTQEVGEKGQSRHSKFIWSNNSHNFHVNQNKK